MGDTNLKAYKAYLANYWEAGSTVVFAENVREAKKAAWRCEICDYWDTKYIDVRVRRCKELDSAYRGKREMDWDDPEDRLAMVKAGWTCFEDYFDPEDCKECSGKQFCSMYKDYLKDVEEEKGGRIMRDINRIDKFCKRLAKAWKMFPDQRFGQLMCNILGDMQMNGRDPFFPEEDEMIEFIEKWCGANNPYQNGGNNAT